MQMRPVFRKQALFTDETSDYRFPQDVKENDMVTIRFRTGADNVDRVLFCHEDMRMAMTLAESDSEFDYYEITVKVEAERYEYHFEILSGMLKCYYDRKGVSGELRPQYEFAIIPGFSVPEWAKGAVIYQIFTDRFCNGDPANDVKTGEYFYICLLYTSPSPRDPKTSRMPSSA